MKQRSKSFVTSGHRDTTFASILKFQRTYDVMITSLWRQNSVATLCWRNNDVIITSCVRWASCMTRVAVRATVGSRNTRLPTPPPPPPPPPPHPPPPTPHLTHPHSPPSTTEWKLPNSKYSIWYFSRCVYLISLLIRNRQEPFTQVGGKNFTQYCSVIIHLGMGLLPDM